MKRPDGTYIGITGLDDLVYHINYIIDNNIKDIGVDTETDGLDYLTCNILGVSLAYKDLDGNNIGLYIPVKRMEVQRSLWDSSNDYLPLDTISACMNCVLSDDTIVKYMHNSKFDLHILERHGFVVSDNIFDTMICAWVLGNVQGAKYGLKHLVKEKLGFDQLDFKYVTGKTNDFTKVDLKTAVDYAGPDGDMTLRLADKEKTVLEKYHTLKPTLKLEFDAIPVLKDMEKIGTPIDVGYLKSLSRTLGKEMREYERQAKSFLGDINIASEQQLKGVLRSKFGFDIDNVSAQTIKFLEKDSEELHNIIEYRKRAKLKSVYCDGLIKLADSDNRVHSSFYQMLKTGRLSSKNPNLQNIPTLKDGSDLPSIRRAFIAPKGYKFVCIDYSQLELRVITHVSKEKYWIDAFNNNEDIHASTAAAVNHIPLDEVTKYQRKRAKFVNFGLLYGESAYGLSKREDMTEEEAQKFIDEYFKVLPNIEFYVRSRKSMVVTHRYTETFNGRRLYFSFDKSDKRAVAAAQREGINFPIQGGASDIVKTAMRQVWNYIQPYKTQLVLQVHDELDFLMAEDEMEDLIPAIENIMGNVFKLEIDLKVDTEYGSDWENIVEWK
jgi:DNA polymerase-1